MGVVVRRYINFLILVIPTPLVLALFLQHHIHANLSKLRDILLKKAESH